MAEMYNEQRVIGVQVLGGGGGGPVTNAQLTAVTGTAATAAWDGVSASATEIAILKAIHAQNAQMITLLTDIKTNTTPAP